MGWVSAKSIATGLKLFLAAATARPTRAILRKWVLPSPGEGPSAAQREQGSFKIQLVGKADADASGCWSAFVSGERDPGYGTTAKMLAESAVCLAKDADQLTVAGGFWTPASCFGMTLVPRLKARAGMRFTVT